MGPTGGGYSNFDYRGMDAPSAAPMKLYDPTTDVADLGYNRPAGPKSHNEIVQAGGAPAGRPGPRRAGHPADAAAEPALRRPGGCVHRTRRHLLRRRAPRHRHRHPHPGAGLGRHPRVGRGRPRDHPGADRAAAEGRRGTQPKLEIVYLEHGDCNYIADTLNSIFARVIIGQSGNYVPASARNPQTAALTATGRGQPDPERVLRRAAAVQRHPHRRAGGPVRRREEGDEAAARPAEPAAPASAFKLKKASAQIVASQIQNFWNSRYPGEPLTRTSSASRSTSRTTRVYVQGSPATSRTPRT